MTDQHTLPEPLRQAVAGLQRGAIHRANPVAGGSICQSWRLEMVEGDRLFAKYLADAPSDLFAAEAHGLATLARGACRVPAVFAVTPRCLLLEWIDPAARPGTFWEEFARQLAANHHVHADAFGLERDNYCGATPQCNTRMTDGHVFFAEQRLGEQLRMARHRRGLDADTAARITALAGRLVELVPAQPPSLLHGDLWSGNLHTGPNGEPVLIDPACYFGWRETDLAMLTLFGAPPEGFFDAYHEAYPLEPEWRERLPLYNLYHLLNHLNLFGDSYLSGVIGVLDRYG